MFISLRRCSMYDISQRYLPCCTGWHKSPVSCRDPFSLLVCCLFGCCCCFDKNTVRLTAGSRSLFDATLFPAVKPFLLSSTWWCEVQITPSLSSSGWRELKRVAILLGSRLCSAMPGSSPVNAPAFCVSLFEAKARFKQTTWYQSPNGGTLSFYSSTVKRVRSWTSVPAKRSRPLGQDSLSDTPRGESQLWASQHTNNSWKKHSGAHMRLRGSATSLLSKHLYLVISQTKPRGHCFLVKVKQTEVKTGKFPTDRDACHRRAAIFLFLNKSSGSCST